MMFFDLFWKDTLFLPSLHGFPFNNPFGFMESLGMVYAALDHYYTGTPMDMDMEAPGAVSSFRSALVNRASNVLDAGLLAKMTAWATSMSPQTRYSESWSLLDRIEPLKRPRIVFVLTKSGSAPLQAQFLPMIIHNFQQEPYVRGYTYNPAVWEGQADGDPVADQSCLQFIRENDPDSGVIGFSSHGDIHGIFMHPYDRDIPDIQLASDPMLTDVRREVQLAASDGQAYRVDSVTLSIPWHCTVITYHSLRMLVAHEYHSSFEDLYLREVEGELQAYTLKDLIKLFSEDCEYHQQLGKSSEYYVLPDTGGTKKITLKMIVEPSDYGARRMKIGFVNSPKFLQYQPEIPRLEATFFTEWPDYFAFGWSDSSQIHGVTSLQVTVRDDYDPAVHGEIDQSQTVFVSGSAGALQWQPDSSLEENLFGAGTAVGFVHRKISCAKRTRFLFDPEVAAEASLWSRSPAGGEPTLESEWSGVVTDLDSFCLNDILAESDPDSRIADGFDDTDFDRDAYMELHLSSKGAARHSVARSYTFRARSRLVFTGIEPPHLKYLEMDLREWILGPCLDTCIEELGILRSHEPMESGRPLYRREAARRIDVVIQHLVKDRLLQATPVQKIIRRFRRLYITRADKLLRSRPESNPEALDSQLQQLRGSCFRSLMNELSVSVIHVAASRRGGRKLTGPNRTP